MRTARRSESRSHGLEKDYKDHSLILFLGRISYVEKFV